MHFTFALMERLLFILISFGCGIFLGWHIKPDTTTIDKEAIKKATEDLDKGSTDLKNEVDKHKL